MVVTKTATTEVPEFALKYREQLVSALKQYQQISVDAAQTWSKFVSALPAFEVPTVPGAPTLPGPEALTKFAFDFGADLLSTQREFALQLASTLVPEK